MILQFNASTSTRNFTDQSTVGYGPVVRIAPDEVHFSDPRAIPLIYRTQKPLEKTDFYHAFKPVTMNGDNLFTFTNEESHAAMLKIVGSIYSLTSILKNEAALDETMNLFMHRIGEFADRDEIFDFGHWLEM